MAYYTCPKCKSTFDLREGMDKCPACLTPISDGIKSEFYSDASFSLDKTEDAASAPKFEDLAFSPVDSTTQPVATDEGSYALGVVLAIFLSWIGLIIAGVTRKRKTIKGAVITFIVTIVLSILLTVLIYILILNGVINMPEEITF